MGPITHQWLRDKGFDKWFLMRPNPDARRWSPCRKVVICSPEDWKELTKLLVDNHYFGGEIPLPRDYTWTVHPQRQRKPRRAPATPGKDVRPRAVENPTAPRAAGPPPARQARPENTRPQAPQHSLEQSLRQENTRLRQAQADLKAEITTLSMQLEAE